MTQNNIRNFCIISHIDHGKSTLADRFLELTQTVEKRKMKEQYLDQMELEREKGITIKLQPVRMLYRASSQTNADGTRNDAENKLLYKDLTYNIRGAAFEVRKKLGLGHKEAVYHKAFEVEFKKRNIRFISEAILPVLYEGKKVGIYQPDFIVEDKIIIELKSLPEIGRPQQEQIWSYIKGSEYKLALLINFGTKDLEIKRIVYDIVREGSCLRQFASSPRDSAQVENYILNLIDTPGHVDFTYEVSRSLQAVEGAILLVDATKGIQAQTLANLHLALDQDLTIIPAINKIDLEGARVEEVENEIKELFLGMGKEDLLDQEIHKISGKEGTGVEELLRAVIEKVPPPKIEKEKPLRALVFDSIYDSYKGVLAYVRIIDGEIKKRDQILMMASGAKSEAIEAGFFRPNLTPAEKLAAGEVGYIATGLKDVNQCRVGDTITLSKNKAEVALAGYKEPKPMLFASFYPSNEKDFDFLKDALNKLKLNDAALAFEPESSALGRGFKCGFLGMLHLEIISERLKREFGLNLVITVPSLTYILAKKHSNEESIIFSASQMPEPHLVKQIKELWVKLEIISPSQNLGKIMQLFENLEGVYKETKYLTSERVIVEYEMPLREIIIDFYDKLKSVTSGYASMSYEILGWRKADLVCLDILIAGDKEEAFSKIVSRDKAQYEGRTMVEKLKEIIPPQMFAVAIQAAIAGKIIARETIRAYKKDVTGHLYGGDYSRKRKLLEKQKRGKKKMKEIGKIHIPQEVFLKAFKK